MVAREGDGAPVSIAPERPAPCPAAQELIFDRFWCGGPARMRSGASTGFGLAIVGSLVEAHGGTIGVQSDQGCGATFTMQLPLTGLDLRRRGASPAIALEDESG